MPFIFRLSSTYLFQTYFSDSAIVFLDSIFLITSIVIIMVIITIGKDISAMEFSDE